ncbi:rod-determining factor RdfA (plasmid) [Halorientalis pallida]|uniref:rod-determining factor RdfA n=1 Tax=Halorientalis pallida TaxID=2479928 RepID=UPI003C704572
MSETDCQCKVGRGVEAFGLDGVHDDLTRRWCGDGRERQSLRELANYFNRRLLRSAVESVDEAPLSGEVSNLYRLLTADDVSSGVRTQTRRRLESAGVPVEDVESAFVSHQTVHTHLTECLGVSRESAEDDPDARRRADRDRIRALQSRTEVVTTDALERLRDSDALALAEFDVLVDVTVLCDECGRQHDVGALLDQGGCDCRE